MGPTPEPLILQGGSFCLTTLDGPGGGWQVTEHRDPTAKGDDLRFNVCRGAAEGGTQWAAENMRSRSLAEAVAGVLNGIYVVTERAAFEAAADQLADDEQPDPVAVAIHDLADAVRSTGKLPKGGATGGILPGPQGIPRPVPGPPHPPVPPPHRPVD